MSTDTPTVLLVEDEEQITALYEGWLDEAYEVRTAHDGEAGLELLDEDIDVALLDRRMTGLSGDELLDRMRERDVDCPVAMVTGVEPTTDALALGFEDYLVKPVGREELLETVDRLYRLTTYDDRIQRKFALASKLAVIESRIDEEKLERHDAYARPRAEVDELSEERTQWQSELSSEDFATLFSLTA
jgi:DNA-binding response OmpR family regulator